MLVLTHIHVHARAHTHWVLHQFRKSLEALTFRGLWELRLRIPDLGRKKKSAKAEFMQQKLVQHKTSRKDKNNRMRYCIVQLRSAKVNMFNTFMTDKASDWIKTTKSNPLLLWCIYHNFSSPLPPKRKKPKPKNYSIKIKIKIVVKLEQANIK